MPKVRKAKWHADIVFRDINMVRGTWINPFPFNKWEELAKKLKQVHSYNQNYSFVCQIHIQFNPYGDKVDE